MTLSNTGAQNSFDLGMPQTAMQRRPRSKAELKLIIKRKAAQQKILECKKGRVRTLQDPDEMTYVSNSSFKQNVHFNMSKLDDIEVLDYKPEKGRATGFRSIKDTPMPHPDLVQSKSLYYKGPQMSIFENENHSKSNLKLFSDRKSRVGLKQVPSNCSASIDTMSVGGSSVNTVKLQNQLQQQIKIRKNIEAKLNTIKSQVVKQKMM